MPHVTFDLRVYCNSCRERLCAESEFAETYSQRQPSICVNACPKCLASARDEKDSEISELNSRIEELEELVRELKGE